MPMYLFRASYSPEGASGLIAEGGTARREVSRAAFEAMGGKLEAYYFAFGEDDVFAIGELPDNETAAGYAMEVASSGVISVTTTVLLTPEEIDRAREKHSGYRPPGA